MGLPFPYKQGIIIGRYVTCQHLFEILVSDIKSFFLQEMAKRRRLNVRSIVDALYMQWNSTGTRSKTNIPKLQITSEYAGSFPYMLEVSFFEFILHIFGLVIQI